MTPLQVAVRLARSPRRLQDDVDLDALARVATDDDLREARQAISLIAARGFARDKDLEVEFSNWRARTGR
jgi:hypothetical protein